MKPVTVLRIVLVPLAVVLAVCGCFERNTTLTITPEGRSVITIEMIAARNLFEQQAKMMGSGGGRPDEEDMFAEPEPEEGADAVEEPAEMEADADAEADAAPEMAPAGQPEAEESELSEEDQELIDDVKAMILDQLDEDGAAVTIETVEFIEDKMRIVATMAFDTVADFAASGTGLEQFIFETMQVDKNDEGNLVFTFNADDDFSEDTEQARMTINASGFKGRFKIVLPGTVLSSSMPQTEGNTTWLAVDANESETVDKFIEVFAAPIEIVCEPGGLQLELPIVTPEGYRSAGPVEDTADIPEAAEPLIAEGSTVQLQTTYYFPEGEKFREEVERTTYGEEDGLTIRARLYAPPGRNFLSVDSVRAVSAVDDQGRAVPVDGEEQDRYVYSSGQFDVEQATESYDITVRLGLPEPDAQAVEELACEAIVETFGDVKQKTLTNIQGDPGNPIDISEVLEGAKLYVWKIKPDPRAEEEDEPGEQPMPVEIPNAEMDEQASGRVAIKLVGPEDIQKVDLDIEIPAAGYVHAYRTRSSWTTEAGQSEGKIVLYYDGQNIQLPPGETVQLNLVISRPDDVRREKVKFTIVGLDLY